MRKLVIKALTNLMAHFTFLALNKLEPLCRLCCICLHLFVGNQQNHVVMGNAFNIALVLCTQLISCSFVYGCRRCEMKGELVSPWSYVCVLEKRLGHQPKPCLIMVETCSITIVTSMKHSSYKKKSQILRKREKEKKEIMKRGKREKITIFPW